MAKKGQKQNRVDESLILKIVQEKIKGKSYTYLSKKYNVSDNTIATWVRRNTLNGSALRTKVGRKKDAKNQTIDDLRIEVDILKKFQAFLKQQHVVK